MSKHIFRFFASRTSDTQWTLDDEDAHHALKVLRLPAGETVEATDGKGTLVRGSLLPTGKESADITNASVMHTDGPVAGLGIVHRIRLELAVGALKPGDLDDVIPALVELGIDRISVFITEETGKNRLADKSIERWNRIIRTATKQSKRLWLPELATFDSIHDWLASLPEASETKDQNARWIFAEPEPDDCTETENIKTQTGFHAVQGFSKRTDGNSVDSPMMLTGLVGSERGFSANEAQAVLKQGFMPVSLGPHILRARTAAIAAATMLAMAGHAVQ